MKRLFCILCLLFSAPLFAAEAEYKLVIKDHKFTPEEIFIPAGKKVKIRIQNMDETPEEFHSDDLKREKVVLGKKTGFVLIGPLAPGRYTFMGEFHESTAKGAVVVK